MIYKVEMKESFELKFENAGIREEGGCTKSEVQLLLGDPVYM